jgi:Phosphotransferase enzyme family
VCFEDNGSSTRPPTVPRTPRCLTATVEAWLREAGVAPNGSIETVHERPWSTVLRIPTADGDLYLKQEAPLQAYEVPLTVALFERWPDRVPEVVAADSERAWLLLRDGGTRIADSGAIELLPRALKLYAELQVGEIGHVDELLAFGLRDLRLPVVAAAYEPFFERDHGLSADEVARLQALAPRFGELCEELAAFDLPASIQHDDLHQWNVFVRGDRVAIYDWGDSSVAFPLWSWLKVRRVALDYDVDPEPFRAAYLSGLTEVAPESQLRAALELAIPSGLFAYALQIRRQYDATQAHEEYETYLPQNLRRLLEQLEAA